MTFEISRFQSETQSESFKLVYEDSQISNCNIQNIPTYRSEVVAKSFSYLQVGMAKKNLKSKIDWHIVSRVRDMRMNSKLGQEDIALHLDVSTGYIGHIESPNFKAKYTTVQINELAKLFKCSPKDFMPEKPL